MDYNRANIEVQPPYRTLYGYAIMAELSSKREFFMPTDKKKPAKKAPAKKSAQSTKKKKQTKKQVLYGSFALHPESQSFFSVRFTHQTLYWVVLSLVILVLGLWVLKLHIAVEELYNNIEISQAAQESHTYSLKVLQSRNIEN